jgi:putative flippase GtrA
MRRRGTLGRFFGRLFAEGTVLTHGYRYVAVGVLNTLIGLGTIYGLYNLFGVDYRIANVAGYTLGIINSFVMNRKWTFKSRGKARLEILIFLGMFGLSYMGNIATVMLCVERFRIPPNLAQLAGMAVYTTTSFFGNRHLTFRARLRPPVEGTAGKENAPAGEPAEM